MLIWRLIPALIWAIIILFLVGLPGSYFPKVVTFWDWLSPDKIVHVIIFMVQTFLLLFAFGKQYLSGNNRLVYIWLILIFVSLYALITEVLQVFVFVGRNGNVFDFLADFAGVLVGLVVFNIYKKKKFANNKVN